MSSPPSSWCARGAIAIEALSAQSGSWPVDETSGVYGHARVASGAQYTAAAALATERFTRDGNKADAEVARECGALAARLAPTARAAWLYVGETMRGHRLRKGQHAGGRRAGGAGGAHMIITSAEGLGLPDVTSVLFATTTCVEENHALEARFMCVCLSLFVCRLCVCLLSLGLPRATISHLFVVVCWCR